MCCFYMFIFVIVLVLILIIVVLVFILEELTREEREGERMFIRILKTDKREYRYFTPDGSAVPAFAGAARIGCRVAKGRVWGGGCCCFAAGGGRCCGWSTTARNGSAGCFGCG